MAVRFVSGILLSILAGACATSSEVVTGTPRSPISANDVTVYTQAPASFEEIAVLNASRESYSPASGERAIDKMIQKFKGQAAMLGANGVLLEEFSDTHAVAVGAGAGSDTYTHNGSISLGLGGSIGIFKKTAKGRAIYIPPG